MLNSKTRPGAFDSRVELLLRRVVVRWGWTEWPMISKQAFVEGWKWWRSRAMGRIDVERDVPQGFRFYFAVLWWAFHGGLELWHDEYRRLWIDLRGLNEDERKGSRWRTYSFHHPFSLDWGNTVSRQLCSEWNYGAFQRACIWYGRWRRNAWRFLPHSNHICNRTKLSRAKPQRRVETRQLANSILFNCERRFYDRKESSRLNFIHTCRLLLRLHLISLLTIDWMASVHTVNFRSNIK